MGTSGTGKCIFLYDQDKNYLQGNRARLLFNFYWLCMIVCLFVVSCVTIDPGSGPGLDKNKPTVKIHKPARLQGIKESKEAIYTSEITVQFSGMVGDESNIKTFRILTDNETIDIGKKGSFEHKLRLHPDLNIIKIEATILWAYSRLPLDQ